MGDRYIFEYVKQAHEQAQSSGSKFSLMLSTFLRLSEYQKNTKKQTPNKKPPNPKKPKKQRMKKTLSLAVILDGHKDL